MTADDLKGAEIRLYVRIRKDGTANFFCYSERGLAKSQWNTSDLNYTPVALAKKIIASLILSVVTALENLPRIRSERVGHSSWTLSDSSNPAQFLPSDKQPDGSPSTTGS